MTMLSIIQDVTDRIGIPRPTQVIGSTDNQVRQLLALLNEEGVALSKRGTWQALTNQWTFVTVATNVQDSSALPSDLRQIIPDSIYNRTLMRKVLGPITPQEWQALQAYPAYNRVYLAFRERQGEILITPAPPADQTIAYEYVSDNWVLSSAAVAKSAFTADDDVSFLEEELLKLGLRWRWKQAKGLNYAEDMNTYEREVQKAIAFDGSSRALNIGGIDQRYPFGANIPEGGFGL